MIIYQIYPRSFKDTNGDGIGDLKGIAEKIPYIADLGAETIWISPYFTSPMRDFGYDVSDYRGVDPIFGTIDDFDQVIKTAHDHGLKIMIDQVWGHSSDLHPWFKESRKDRNNDKKDWYIWADPKRDGFYPNNWLSIFGGPAWTWDGNRRQYYLHHFLHTQPAFNLRNPEVFEAIMQDSLFWIERGVDSFRVDALPHFLADEALRDNPPASGEDDTFTNASNPRGMQDNIYTQSVPDLMPWIEQTRHWFKSRGKDVLMLAEVMTGGMALASACVKGDNRLQTAYTGELINTDWSAQHIKELMQQSQNSFDDPHKMCWALGNHDVYRLATRLQEKENAEDLWRLIIAWYFCLEGHLCWYQGDELHLKDGEITFEQLQDPFGKAFWPEYKGRDGCRTPMPWDSKQSEAGFTTGSPWLPIASEHFRNAVDTQIGKENSFLETTRFAMQLRRNYTALSNGKTVLLNETGLVGFIRETAEQRILCLFNFSPDQSIPLLQQGKKIVSQSGNDHDQIKPYGFYIAEI